MIRIFIKESNAVFSPYSISKPPHRKMANEEEEVSTLKVRNKAPAPIQITAEQLLREAHERKDILFKPIKQSFEGPEAEENKLFRRKHFEDLVKRFPNQITNWLRYAQWEESISELERARSIFERAVSIDPLSISLWLRYSEFEIRSKNINCARNVFIRAIEILPRVDQLWYKFVYIEEFLGNVENAREIYWNWMKWKPSDAIWYSFIKFESRRKNWKVVREIYTKLLEVHCTSENWIKFSTFEQQIHQFQRAKEVLETALRVLRDDELEPKLFSTFAKLSHRYLQEPLEITREIFQQGLKRLSGDKRESLFNSWLLFEKQYGKCEEVERIVYEKRMKMYEQKLNANSKDYDIWFDYLRLEEENEHTENQRAIFQRVLKDLPPVQEKKYWRRWIYFWIYWATFEELTMNQSQEVERIYENCLSVIPHDKFTFAKIWIYYAKFLIRQDRLNDARKLLGRALGICPKKRLFEAYIELELDLKEFDRVRMIYGKYIDWNSSIVETWIKFCQFEAALAEFSRVRAIFELALQQEEKDNPELLWKSFIDFEYSQQNWEGVRSLYERLLSISEHVKIWISFATFEASIENLLECRAVFKRAYESLKKQQLNEERVLLLMAWKEFELQHSTTEENNYLTEVEQMFPVKQVREVAAEFAPDGTMIRDAEQVVEYEWPDVSDSKDKLLEIARKWKATKN